MNVQVSLEKLRGLKLSGMAQALEDQLAAAESRDLSFEDRLSLMIDREGTWRHNRQYQQRLRLAKFKEPQARIESLEFTTGRNLDKPAVLSLATSEWVRGKQNVFVIGPTGVGKTYMSCALGHRACMDGYSVRYYRMPRLLQALAIARADGSYKATLAGLAKIDVLVLDDWGIAGLSTDERRDFLELIEDRYGQRSTVMASQIPVENWFDLIGDPTIADAILDRLVHAAHRINLKGISLRKAKSTLTDDQQPN